MDPLNQEIKDYVFSFASPVEADFFKPEQVKQLAAETAKRDASKEFVAAIIDKDDFEERIQKAVVEGKIYSASQMQGVNERLDAYLESSGSKVSVQETLVSPTGQRIIMSDRLAEVLGFYTDGYMVKGELDQLTGALQSDGVPGPEIDKVTAAMAKHGAIVLQKGLFLILKNLLEDALGRTLSSFNKNAGYNPPPMAVVQSSAQPPQGTSPDQMPYSFIEYLKNTDKEFDRVEHEVMSDPQFQEFFAGLQKQYAYYQKLPADRMAGEVITRPQLWAKLSPQTKVWVQNIVNRNREQFQGKVKQVGTAAHAEKLDELKKALGK